jgi:molybdopterin-guanine dinucleotide biosynthesis protein A
MPLIQVPVIQKLISSIGEEDVLLPVIEGVRQPLHAVYKRRLLPVVKRLCMSVEGYLPDLFGAARIRLLDESSFSDLPDYGLSFLSINSRDDLSNYAPFLAGD